MYARELPPKPEDPAVLLDQLGEYSRARTFDEADQRYGELTDLAQAVELLGDAADTDLAIAKIDKRGPRVAEIPGMHERRCGYHTGAYGYFAKANRAYERIESGEDARLIHRETWNAFLTFKQRYEGAKAENYQARTEYKKRLAGNFAALLSLDNEVYISRVKNAEQTAPYPQYLGEGEHDEREKTLTTKEKLIGLRDDPRAGFIPATHREKNVSIELLDYLDNPDYPYGIENRLVQIYSRQVNLPLQAVGEAKRTARANGEPYIGKSTQTAWVEGRAMAADTIRSILHEWGDYVANARYSLVELGALNEVLERMDNPKLTLLEALNDAGDLAPDAQPLLRYMVLERFRETGALPSPVFDPLRTRIIRQTGMPNKNKLIADVFLTPADAEHLGDYFEQLKHTVTVGKLRTGKVVQNACADSRRRLAFHSGNLAGVPGTSSYYQYAQEAIRTAA